MTHEPTPEEALAALERLRFAHMAANDSVGADLVYTLRTFIQTAGADTARLAYVYSNVPTDSTALIEIEAMLHFTKSTPTLERVRAAIDDAMSKSTAEMKHG